MHPHTQVHRALPAMLLTALAWSGTAAAQDMELVSFTSPPTATLGGSVQVSATVRNNDTVYGEAFVVIRASSDAVYHTTDEFLCYLPSTLDDYLLDPGESDSTTTTCTFPATATNATHLVASLVVYGTDPDRGDNEAANPVSIGGTTPTGPDLVAVSVSGPATATSGQAVALSMVARNDGDEASTATTARILFGDGTFDASDPEVCSIALPALNPSAQVTLNPTGCAIPGGTSPGTYALWGEVNPDASSDDSSPGNDTTSTGIDVVAAAKADLTAEVSVPSTVQRGAGFSLDWTVRNASNGVQAGASTLRVDFIDANATRTTGLCGPASVATVASGGNRTGGITGCSVPAGAALGVAQVEVVADAADVVDEGNESNNVGVGTITVVAVPPPDKADLVVSSAAGPVQVAPGDAFDIEVGLRNVGTDPASGVITVVRWSTSDRPDSATEEVGRDSARTLATGAATPTYVTIPGTVPTTAGSGQAWLHVTTDDPNTVDELDETNNTRIVPLTVVSADNDPGTQPSDTDPLVDDTALGADTDRATGDTDLAGPGTVQFGCSCRQAGPGLPGVAALSGWVLVGALIGRRRRR